VDRERQEDKKMRVDREREEVEYTLAFHRKRKGMEVEYKMKRVDKETER